MYSGIVLSMRRMRMGMALVGLLAVNVGGEEPARLQATGEVPAGHVVLKSTLGGAYCIARPLKERYDKLLGAVQAVQADLDAERIEAADALEELESLQRELKTLRAEIEAKKVLVSPLKVHRQTETTTFEMGKARRLVMTADNIRVEGWDGSQVKCVLEKVVLAVDDQPVDAHLRELKVARRYGSAPDLVGKTTAERDAEERKFLDSAEGRKLTATQREHRAQVLEEIAGSYELYREFQGQEIDTLAIEGLTHEQGNRWVSLDFPSADGGGSYHMGTWQRSAALTVYVPTCQAVALRGCKVNLAVSGVHAAVILTAQGSQDNDYDGTFTVRDVWGALTVQEAPLDRLEQIHGDVSIRATTEMVNTGTRHEGGQRTLYSPPPRALTCRGIEGDFTAWFTRAQLSLAGIKGRIDVRNEFGDTTLTIDQTLAEQAHRVISESGRVELRGSKAALRRLPLMVLTNCGTVRTNAEQSALEDTSFAVARDWMGTSRNWRGLVSRSSSGPLAFMERTDRVVAVMKGAGRSPGLDLVTRGGAARVHVIEAAEAGQ